MRTTKRSISALALALCLALTPFSAFAATDVSAQANSTVLVAGSGSSNADDADEVALQAEKKQREETQAELKAQLEENEKAAAEQEQREREEAEKAAREKTDKKLSYDKKLIAKVGTQESTGHTICCPSFSCAYGDVVIDGTCRDHSYYTCSCCTWNDWGGGQSANRCVGTSEELLREAYDQIKAGKPTVIHVAGAAGEHWICLIGYKNAKDPDHLTLENFIALDPWDGAEITASSRYSLYGDGCEHISSR